MVTPPSSSPPRQRYGIVLMDKQMRTHGRSRMLLNAAARIQGTGRAGQRTTCRERRTSSSASSAQYGAHQGRAPSWMECLDAWSKGKKGAASAANRAARPVAQPDPTPTRSQILPRFVQVTLCGVLSLCLVCLLQRSVTLRKTLLPLTYTYLDVRRSRIESSLVGVHWAERRAVLAQNTHMYT